MIKFKELNYPAGLASLLIVGLGQALTGEPKKGLRLMLLFYFVLPALLYASLAVNGNLFLLCLGLVVASAIIIWSYSVIKALEKK